MAIQKWEHLIIDLTTLIRKNIRNKKPSSVEYILDEFGEEGWELVQLENVPAHDIFSSYTNAILKRPKQPEPIEREEHIPKVFKSILDACSGDA